MSTTGITVHCRIRNEECFIEPVLRSILPLADRVMVYDTGSTDSTVERVKAVRDPRIELVQIGKLSPVELTALRNEMADRTTTEWFMKVDGDEIYPAHAVQRIPQLLAKMSADVHRIVIHRVHFYESYNFVSGQDSLGRIFRTKTMRTGITPTPGNSVGHETPYFIDEPLRPWRTYSVTMPSDVYFFHCQYMQRSRQDEALGRLRGWRPPPFPLWPYFGPWPEGLATDGLHTRWSPAFVLAWLRLNGRVLAGSTTRGMWRPPKPKLEWRLKSRPPKSLIVPKSWAELREGVRQAV